MRIAVCFSGQIRTGIENYTNIKEFFGELYDNCDFFIHTWNFCEYKSYNLSNIAKKPIIESPQKFNTIKQLYSPKKMIVDAKNMGYNTSQLYGIQPLWYSFWKCNELKKQYELENDFKYDIVLKLRTDTIFNNKINALINEIETTYIGEFKTIQNYDIDIAKNIATADDVFFISKSTEMDIAADYYWQLMKSYDNGEYINLAHHLNQNKIKIKQATHCERHCLLRDDFIKDGVLNLPKSDLWDRIGELETYYYNAPILPNVKYFINDLRIEFKKRGIVLDENKKYYLEDLL